MTLNSKTGKSFNVKKVTRFTMEGIPMSAEYWDDCYTPEGVYSIWRTPNGVLYAKFNRSQP